MNQRTSDRVIQFTETQRDSQQESDPIDRSGHAVVALLSDAAGMTKQSCERAMRIAEKLSMQLRAAEDHVAALEEEIRHYHDRVTRAESWMHRIHAEIENRFFKERARHRIPT
jgi:Mg2+ and Co2+ transporter CorA